jgi:hypothetical protein
LRHPEHYDYELYLAVEDIDHTRTKTKSPQTNGICERFHRTVLDEFYRVAFRKKIYRTIDELQSDLDAWVKEHNGTRPHQGRWCYGKTQMQTFFDALPVCEGEIVAGRVTPDTGSSSDTRHDEEPSVRSSTSFYTRMAQQAGADLTPWKTGLPPQPQGPTATAALGESGIVGPTPSSRRGAIAVRSLPPIPRKRRWLHGTDVARGAVSLLVAPSARGKSTWLLTLALACASGRTLLCTHVFGGPLRVLYINAEDSTNKIGRRIRAAMTHHALKDSDVPGLHVAGVDYLRLTLLSAERGQPRLNQPDWNFLAAEIDRLEPDLVLIDLLVSLVGGVSLNDNSAAPLVFGNLVRIVAERNLGIMIAHHAAKHRESSSADAAMGAASLVNLARIFLAIEPLSEGDATKVGVAPWDARSTFRVIGTKQNLSPPDTNDRWFGWCR